MTVSKPIEMEWNRMSQSCHNNDRTVSSLTWRPVEEVGDAADEERRVVDALHGRGADLGQREEAAKVLGPLLGEAPRQQPHLRVGVQRDVHGHVFLVFQHVIGQRSRLRLSN